MDPTSDAPDNGATLKFGTDAFYAAIGRAFIALCAFVPVLWLIELVDTAVGGRLERAGGIHPRRIEGLDGLVFAPFLHVDFAHLAANSVPLILLGTFVLAGQIRRFVLVTALIVIVSGLGVWITGATNSYVVGASGVIFGYLGYLMVSGIVDRTLWRLLVALLVGLLYGWTIVGVLPGDEGVSWQGHLFGFLAGAAAAILFRSRRVEAPRTLAQ